MPVCIKCGKLGFDIIDGVCIDCYKGKNGGEKMKCGNCGCKFAGHTCITDEKAEFGGGDVSICLNCGDVHQYKNGVLEVIDIRDLPKETQEEILKINVARQKVIGEMAIRRRMMNGSGN